MGWVQDVAGTSSCWDWARRSAARAPARDPAARLDASAGDLVAPAQRPADPALAARLRAGHLRLPAGLRGRPRARRGRGRRRDRGRGDPCRAPAPTRLGARLGWPDDRLRRPRPHLGRLHRGPLPLLRDHDPADPLRGLGPVHRRRGLRPDPPRDRRHPRPGVGLQPPRRDRRSLEVGRDPRPLHRRRGRRRAGRVEAERAAPRCDRGGAATRARQRALARGGGATRPPRELRVQPGHGRGPLVGRAATRSSASTRGPRSRATSAT